MDYISMQTRFQGEVTWCPYMEALKISIPTMFTGSCRNVLIYTYFWGNSEEENVDSCEIQLEGYFIFPLGLKETH